MAHDKDNPLGVEIRGTERPMPFVHPYRQVGELNQVERWKLERHPLEVADAIIDTLRQGGARGHRQGAGRGGAAQVGRPLPPAPGRRRLHDAGQGPRRRARPRTRPARSAWPPTPSARGPTTVPVFGNRYADITTRQTIQIHWIRIADVPRIWRALRRCRAHHGPGLRGLGPQRPVLPGLGRGRRGGLRRAARRPGDLGVLHRQPRVRQPPPQVQDERDRVPSRTAPRRRSTTSGCGRRGRPTARSGSTCWSGGGLSDGERMASDIDVFVRARPGGRDHPGHRPALR